MMTPSPSETSPAENRHPKASRAPVARRRNKEMSKQKLLQAAIETFSKVGFDGATTKVIAKRAGVNESLINRYFNSKEGLLSAVTEKFIQQTATYAMNYPICATLEEELTQYCYHRFEQELADRNLLRITISQCALDSKLCEKVQEFLPFRKEIFLQERVQALKAAGKVRADADEAQVSRTVGFQVFSSAFLSTMVFGFEKSEVLASLQDFCRTYARGLQP